MRSLLRAVVFLLIASVIAGAQSVVAGWFPVHAGDRWTYEHESRDDTGGAHPEIRRWTTEEAIYGRWVVPQGTLIGMRVRLVAGAVPPGYRNYPEASAYLIRGNCIYTRAVDWDPQRHELTTDFVQRLERGPYSPDFCFPLVIGATWGAPHWAEWRSPADAKDWKVVDAEASASPSQKETFHIASVSSYLGSGMSADIWLEKGIGIVREDEIHHGTVGEIHTRLLRFQPAITR